MDYKWEKCIRFHYHKHDNETLWFKLMMPSAQEHSCDGLPSWCIFPVYVMIS